jgi:hypothetical protein
MTGSKEYLAALEQRKIESGGTRIPTLDEWGELIELTWEELQQREAEMNTQRPFITRRPSQRYDFHRMPVEGSYAMRRAHNRRIATYVALGILAIIILLTQVL